MKLKHPFWYGLVTFCSIILFHSEIGRTDEISDFDPGEQIIGEYTGIDRNTGKTCTLKLERSEDGKGYRASPNDEAPYDVVRTSHSDVNRLYGAKETSSAGFIVRWFFNYVSVNFDEQWQKPISYSFSDNYSTWGRFLGPSATVECSDLTPVEK